MPIDTSLDELVNQLTRVKLRPPERLVKHILDHGDAAREPLLALATDFNLFDEHLIAQRLGPLHALRLLGELAGPANVAPLLNVLPVPIYDEEDSDVATALWAREVMQIIGRGGSAVVPALWEYADDEANSDNGRAAALGSLPFAIAMAGEGREEVLVEIRRRLENETSPMINAALVRVLAFLGDGASYRQVMDAYRAGRIDQYIMPAAQARQLLLSKGAEELACVRHQLWERYDEHGADRGR
ncbi:hypothetical protein HC891_23110, partial [Candidatus Gracilibacteria bacterium]|nr:hypothetical protein [Candidatus Gracilibacteria bacterium]